MGSKQQIGRGILLGLTLSMGLTVVPMSCGEPEPTEAVSDADDGGLTDLKLSPPPVEGAVLSVAGQVILRADLEEIADAAGLAQPESSRPHHVRLALDNLLIPRAALAAAHSEQRALAKAAAEETLLELQAQTTSGAIHGAEMQELDVRKLGLALWYEFRHSQPGKWIGPVEDVGRFRLARWVLVEAGPKPGQNAYTCEILDFWFLEDTYPRPWVDAALAKAELLVHDMEIGKLVTVSMRWSMKRN
ncbi:MAG: hypothetical protein ACI8QS_001392 [Planctomycetota bacterium]|jgi:hypothetical protein